MTNVSDSRLLALLQGTLSPEEEAALSDLVAASPELEQRLAKLSGASSFEDEFETAHRRNRSGGEASGPVLETVYRGLLDPPDDSESLGKLGPYVILEHIATGGMGVLFKAHDPNLDRLVALKILSPALAAGDDARRRFLIEAQAVASLNHPNIIPVHAIETEANPPFIVMRYVEGESLQDRLDRNDGNPLELGEVLQIAIAIASALAAAHEPRSLSSSQSNSALAAGLIHRDIKPSNILLEKSEIEDRESKIYLTDFGLARPLEPGATDLSLTRTGQFLGTPQYMSPEQAAGSREIDHRTDLFSFGAVLYAAATGHAPFRGESFQELSHQIAESAPAPPRDLNKQLPAWFANLVTRLLAKNPADRPHSASEVLATIEEKTNLGTLSRARLVGHRTRRRNRLVRTAQVALAALLAVASLAKALDATGKTATANLLLSTLTGRPFSIETRLAVYPDLAAAVNAAETGDTILVRSRAPVALRAPVLIPEGVALTLRGAPGRQTVLEVVTPTSASAIRTASPLELRNLVLLTHTRDLPPPLVESTGAPLTIDSCWLIRQRHEKLLRFPSNIDASLVRALGVPSLLIRNSILSSFDITAVRHSPPHDVNPTVALDQVMSFGAHALYLSGSMPETTTVRVSRSILSGARPFTLRPGGAGPMAAFDARDSFFEDVRLFAAIGWKTEQFLKKITWRGEGNDYRLRFGFVGPAPGSPPLLERIETLESWRRFTGSSEKGSTLVAEGTPWLDLMHDTASNLDLESLRQALRDRDLPSGIGPDPAFLGPR